MSSLTNTYPGVQMEPNDIAAKALSRRWLVKMQYVGAAIGLFGGAATALSGSILTAAGWFVTNDGARQWLSTSGSVLLYLTIPLIILGAYCLDWMEKDKSQVKSKIARDEEDDDQ
ncbi:MAG: hypothetical protein L0226_02435 [Acidobacteria bacterium]|nr:hypothetical protein [Acidobacteriota bacterium]